MSRRPCRRSGSATGQSVSIEQDGGWSFAPRRSTTAMPVTSAGDSPRWERVVRGFLADLPDELGGVQHAGFGLDDHELAGPAGHGVEPDVSALT